MDTDENRTEWNRRLRDQFQQPYWHDLQEFVRSERRDHTVYPPHDEVFRALHLTPSTDVKVVIVGQDPYHGPGQANGLAFSVRQGMRIPPSLRNIHTELHDDLGCPLPGHGDLEAWARQGVLLLNTSLTVRAGQAGSHAGHGWETFTDRVIEVVDAGPDPVVFVLWGNHARAKAARIDRTRHRIIESTHPSPFSAHHGFFGSRPFSAANRELGDLGRDPVDWDLSGSTGDESGTH